MKKIETDIVISAPMEKVWDILMDFDKWKKWNPIVNDARGVASLGSKIQVVMRGSEGRDGQKYTATIKTFEAPRLFRWRGTMMHGALMTNDKVFELEPSEDGTRVYHAEEFSGLMVPLFWGKMKDFVPKALNSLNQALKKQAEKA